jgi:hypothetical protein
MPQYANTTEILDAFASLNDSEVLALRKCAWNLLDGTSFSEPLDLIYEALNRSLDGRRNWPIHIDFGAYMNMTMKSISSGDRKLFKNKYASPVSLNELMETAPDALPCAISAEEEILAAEQFHIAHKAADAVRAALANDGEALRVLGGLQAGMSPREMCEEFSLTPKALDAARHRVMRRMQKHRTLH